jgi:hypothetical protein
LFNSCNSRNITDNSYKLLKNPGYRYTPQRCTHTQIKCRFPEVHLIYDIKIQLIIIITKKKSIYKHTVNDSSISALDHTYWLILSPMNLHIIIILSSVCVQKSLYFKLSIKQIISCNCNWIKNHNHYSWCNCSLMLLYLF